MATLPTRFPPVIAPAIASYNYQDIAENTGIVQFYGYVTDENVTSYRCSNTAVYSQKVSLSGSGVNQCSGAFTTSAFVLPKTIKGTTTFVIPRMVRQVTGSVFDTYVQVRTYKVDTSSNDTLLNTTSGCRRIFATGDTGHFGDMCTMSTTLSETHLAQGEKLKFVVEFLSGATNNTFLNPAYIVMGTDPKARNDQYFTTNINTVSGGAISQMSFLIPQKLDLV